ncbi:MAG: hydroxyethylthiazole kinase [Synergistaceae bacterium]|nr:hydroxyethylthiazole kinase [Synergistaceae bacterium]
MPCKIIDESIENDVIAAIIRLKSSRNIIANVTNTVSQNLVANVELALGVSPIMFNMPDEAKEIVSISSAAYINLGTVIPIYEQTIPSMLISLKNNKLPWVLDPVAVGFGKLRNKLFLHMLETKCFPSVIRGNATEIITLANLWSLTQNQILITSGVDTINTTEEAESAAISLSLFTNATIAVSGEVDFITNGEKHFHLYGGSIMMEQVTGMGCSLGGAIAAFLTVTSPLYAAIAASMIYKIAGKISATNSQGLGDFVSNFHNLINKIGKTEILENKVLTNNKLNV